jgi:ABC-type branched-subunit amino acid transport system substrate-binding protein
VIATSFYDHRRGGLPPGVAKRVEVMVPLYDAGTSAPFVTAFKKAYKTDPGPYAIYAYGAMQLALDAIAQSGGDREAIRDELLHTSDRRDSMLGRYSIDPSTGDILVRSYGVSRIVDGRLAAPQRAPQLAPR